MKRVYNFSAGPATLPEAVLLRIQKECLDVNGSGMSVMEMSHRSQFFEDILNKTKQALIDCLSIPNNYEVLFLQGGASLQFTMIPMNLLKKSKEVDIINTGVWSQKAIEEASLFGKVNVIASSESDQFKSLPKITHELLSKEADYLHYVSNNTVYGTQFKEVPIDHPTLVCDMSSDICSKPIDVSRFGLIFAGAQKNLGIAGLTIVIIRKDLLDTKALRLPKMLDYSVFAKNNSLYNTPSSFGIYVSGLVLEWIKDLGGLDAMYRLNQEKANLLYQAIDQSKLFINTISPNDRSMMNVMFSTNEDALDDRFIQFAEDNACVGIRGHRITKGCRASIYNAMSLEGVKALITCMHVFEDSILKERADV
jgi:phosphoserine aminotransferase